MKFQKNEKYGAISGYAILTFFVCLLLVTLMNNLSSILNGAAIFINGITPVIWGVVIAYLLNPIMKWSEDALAKMTDRKKPHPKLKRILATVISVLVLLAGLSALISIIIPSVYNSIMSIVNSLEDYITNLEKWFNDLLRNFPDLNQLIDEQLDDIRTILGDLMDKVIPKLEDLGDLMVKIKDGAVSVVSVISDFFIGLIVAVYFLLDKEHFLAQSRKLITAVVPKKGLHTVFRICTLTNRSLSGFISGKIIDSIIIGILCLILMTIFRFDYAMLISVIIGVTNIIPVFGPIFGAIPCALLLLISSPKKVIWFIILIVAIQQLDGNVIGPKILGNTTGLSAFWVLFAILVGGEAFGVAGMLLGVPVFAVVYSLTQEGVNYILQKKGLSTDTADYAPVPKPKKPAAPGDMKSFKLWRKSKDGENTAVTAKSDTNSLPESSDKS